MERDRAAVLTLRTAANGTVDYTKADLHNPMWWKHWRYMIRAVDNAEYGDRLQRAYEFQLALVSNSGLNSDSFAAVQKEAKELFKDIEGASRPWLGRTKADRANQEGKDFKEQWEELAGFNPDDKEALAKWSESVKQVTDAKADERTSTEREAGNRLLRFRERVDEIKQKRLKQQGRK